jgi:peptidoglycan/LPS O-acetylase OafA/YrhL
MAIASIQSQPGAQGRTGTFVSRLAHLLPVSANPGEIASLDGLRAIAALSVMLFHCYYLVTRHVIIGGVDVAFIWNYGQSGIHLFFVLSGFLLFTPYARAMLNAQPLPSTRRFFQRRALRILPAYYVCLAILAVLQFPSLLSLAGLENIGVHIIMLHDDFATTNRAINGPFWTLAIEAQFYVVLPLFAWAIARFVGATRSRLRIVVGVLGVIAGALVLRMVDEVVQGKLANRHGVVGSLAKVFFHLTFGVQGKYLEVFALGMLCSVLYLAAQEESRRLRRSLPWLGAALVAVAVVAMIGLAKVQMAQDVLTPPYFLLTHATDLLVVGGPLLTGLPYAALTIGVLWAPRWLRAVFELRALRFIGLISYSLYLWHLPILNVAERAATALPQDARIWFMILIGFTVAVPVAFLSYHFVERPFLARRRNLAAPQPA